jgi:preprotein translocase subunit SecE
MNDKLIFSFTPNKSDYIKTLRAFSLHHETTKIGLLLSALVIVAILLSIFYLHTLSLAGFTVLLVMVVYYITVFFLGPANIADKAAKDERLSCEMTWEVDENQALVCTRTTDINCDWSTFAEAYETKEHFLITYTNNKNMFQLIPKRAFKTAEQIAQFRKLLEEKTKPIKKIESVNLPELSRNFSMVLLYIVAAIFLIIVVAYGISHGVLR